MIRVSPVRHQTSNRSDVAARLLAYEAVTETFHYVRGIPHFVQSRGEGAGGSLVVAPDSQSASLDSCPERKPMGSRPSAV